MNYNAFSVGYMTKTYNGFTKTCEVLGQIGKSKKFGEELAEKYEKIRGMTQIDKASFTKDMSMEEYKRYIHDKISQIPLDSSQSGWIWNIQITEEGFEAMKNDPEYEAYVLDTVRKNFSYFDVWHSKNWSVLHFGATKEESYGQSYLSASSFELNKEKTFWERRLEKQEKRKEQLDKFVEKKKRLEREQMIKTDAAVFFDANMIVENDKTNAL